VGVGREAKFLKGGEFGTTQEGSSKVRYHRDYVIFFSADLTDHSSCNYRGPCMCAVPTEASQSKIRSVED